MTEKNPRNERTPEEIEMAEMLHSIVANHKADAIDRDARNAEEDERQRKEADAYTAMIASSDAPNAEQEEQS